MTDTGWRADASSPVRRALVSVSDKGELELLARILDAHRVEVLSTGGTFETLESLGCAVVKVGELTGAPEILDGRVKTLHPKIHGGILALPNEAHERELKLHGIAPIDLVVVNLYPFRETIARPGATFEEAIENIDIGGPAMIRAAAKNWTRVTVLVEPRDYVEFGRVLAANEGRVPPEFRRAMARKAFAHTAAYDAAIATYLARHDDQGRALAPDELDPALFVSGREAAALRYGENPHQKARFFATEFARREPPGLDRVVHHNPAAKTLSYNNYLDADAALGLARDLAPAGAAALLKHLSPCGVALARTSDESIADVYERAREADPESAFGGIVVVTRKVDLALAERLAATFLEIVLAPAFDADAAELLSARRQDLRLLALESVSEPAREPMPLRLRSVAGGLLVQREDRIATSAAQGRPCGSASTAPETLRDLDFALRVAKHVRSNAIVLVRDGVTVGIGGGQTSRVEAVRQALARAGERARGAVVASDAFFPFRDSVDVLAAAGVTAIVQPGGSKRDAEVIEAVHERGLIMILTGERHFRH